MMSGKMETEEPILKMTKRWTVGRWIALSVMTYTYLVGELSHFLLGIVSRPMSQELHYGDKGCLPNPQAEHQSSDCRTLNDTTCYDLIEDNGNLTTCVWDYSGLGLEYQVLAGPAFIFVFTTAGIVLGVVSDKFNRKIVVTVCCGVLTLATGLTGGATTYWHLVILRMLMGAGESSFTPACSSMISDMFPESIRAMALGIFNWGIYLGYGLSYAVGNFVTAADILGMGWRWSYIITGIMGVVATFLLFILVDEPPRGGQINTNLEENNTSTTPVSDQPSDTKEHRNSVSSINSQSKQDLISDKPKLVEGLKSLFTWPVMMLAFAACVRHTAGFSWAYNTQLYFLTYYPDFNLGLWVTAVSIVGGTLGVAVGGLVSDKLVKRLGMKARLYVLAGSQLLATPFAAGVLFLPPPGAFYSLLGAYLFAEMWFGVLFAVLLELVSGSVQSVGIAIFLFVMNNVGGNLPVIVDPLARLTDYRTALLIMYPGGFLLSAVLFFLTSFFLR